MLLTWFNTLIHLISRIMVDSTVLNILFMWETKLWKKNRDLICCFNFPYKDWCNESVNMNGYVFCSSWMKLCIVEVYSHSELLCMLGRIVFWLKEYMLAHEHNFTWAFKAHSLALLNVWDEHSSTFKFDIMNLPDICHGLPLSQRLISGTQAVKWHESQRKRHTLKQEHHYTTLL